MNIPVNLATEDELSEAVLRRLLDHADRGYAIGTAYGRRGFGYLRRTITGWNRAAQFVPFIVLTDLDRRPCPTELIDHEGRGRGSGGGGVVAEAEGTPPAG